MVHDSQTVRNLATRLLGTALLFPDPDSVGEVKSYTVSQLLAENFLPAFVPEGGIDGEDHGRVLIQLGEELSVLARTGRANPTVLTNAERALPHMIDAVRGDEDDAKHGVIEAQASEQALLDRLLRHVIAPRHLGLPGEDPERVLNKPVTGDEVLAMQAEAREAKKTAGLCRQALTRVFKGLREINEALGREGQNNPRGL